MSIVGNGVDIIENKRIKKSLKKKGFINRIFTKNEINKSKKLNNKINYYAKRFAAKEAFSKALGTGIRKEIKFKDISISNDSFGKPFIRLSGSTKKYLIKQLKTKKYFIYLSLSDDLPWAQATVIISYTK